MREPKKTSLQSWFHWFTEWVRDFVRKARNPAERKLVIIESRQSRDTLGVAQSVMRPTPGAVSTWYITHSSYANAHIIVALDNIHELKQFLDDSEPAETQNVRRTHLISVQWLIKVGAKRKQLYKFKGAWLADLQGSSSSINAKASDVVKYLVLEILNLPATSGISWEARIDRFNWEEEIMSKCKIIADNHKAYLKPVKRSDIYVER